MGMEQEDREGWRGLGKVGERRKWTPQEAGSVFNQLKNFSATVQPLIC